jgi:hypothetical protein
VENIEHVWSLDIDYRVKHGNKEYIAIDKEKLAALWEIAKTIATQNTTYSDDFMDNYCIFCCGDENYEDPDNYKHEPSCIVLKARALVAQKCSDQH